MSSKAFNITLPDNLVKQMDKFAKKNYMTRSELIKLSVIKELKANQDEWEEVVDFTKIRKGGVRVEEVLEAIQKLQRQ